MSKKLTIGDGLDSLAGAILLVAILWFVYCIAAGFVHMARLDNDELKARCDSLSGYYGDGKCFIKGEEQ